MVFDTQRYDIFTFVHALASTPSSSAVSLSPPVMPFSQTASFPASPSPIASVTSLSTSTAFSPPSHVSSPSSLSPLNESVFSPGSFCLHLFPLSLQLYLLFFHPFYFLPIPHRLLSLQLRFFFTPAFLRSAPPLLLLCHELFSVIRE